MYFILGILLFYMHKQQYRVKLCNQKFFDKIKEENIMTYKKYITAYYIMFAEKTMIFC